MLYIQINLNQELTEESDVTKDAKRALELDSLLTAMEEADNTDNPEYEALRDELTDLESLTEEGANVVDTFEDTIGKWYPAAIENDDYSGMDDSEEEQVKEWLDEVYAMHPGSTVTFEYGDGEDFGKDSITGLDGDVITVTATFFAKDTVEEELTDDDINNMNDAGEFEEAIDLIPKLTKEDKNSIIDEAFNDVEGFEDTVWDVYDKFGVEDADDLPDAEFESLFNQADELLAEVEQEKEDNYEETPEDHAYNAASFNAGELLEESESRELRSIGSSAIKGKITLIEEAQYYVVDDKAFAVRKVTTDMNEANDFMSENPDVALIDEIDDELYIVDLDPTDGIDTGIDGTKGNNGKVVDSIEECNKAKKTFEEAVEKQFVDPDAVLHAENLWFGSEENRDEAIALANLVKDKPELGLQLGYDPLVMNNQFDTIMTLLTDGVFNGYGLVQENKLAEIQLDLVQIIEDMVYEAGEKTNKYEDNIVAFANSLYNTGNYEEFTNGGRETRLALVQTDADSELREFFNEAYLDEQGFDYDGDGVEDFRDEDLDGFNDLKKYEIITIINEQGTDFITSLIGDNIDDGIAVNYQPTFGPDIAADLIGSALGRAGLDPVGSVIDERGLDQYNFESPCGGTAAFTPVSPLRFLEYFFSEL